VFTIRTATGQQRTVHPADLREAIHLMAENEPDTGDDTGHETGHDTDAHDEEDARDEEQDPDAA
jgi:hypothetical protein